jgi:hypothetical protein
MEGAVMSLYQEYLEYRLTGRCPSLFWQRKFDGASGGGGETPGGSGGESVELLSWDGVAHHIKRGDYATAYKIGDEIPLDMGSEGQINMQVAAFDTDDLADGSGKAPITFIARELLATSLRWNPKVSGTSGAYVEGTGSIGGWEKCEARAYMNNTIKPMIPSDVANMIVAVNKTQKAFDTTAKSFTQTTSEEVWIPAAHEVFGSTLVYDGLFSTATDNTGNKTRVKLIADKSTAGYWWVRDSERYNYAYKITDSGGHNGYTPDLEYYICLCFCVGRTP